MCVFMPFLVVVVVVASGVCTRDGGQSAIRPAGSDARSPARPPLQPTHTNTHTHALAMSFSSPSSSSLVSTSDSDSSGPALVVRVTPRAALAVAGLVSAAYGVHRIRRWADQRRMTREALRKEKEKIRAKRVGLETRDTIAHARGAAREAAPTRQ